MPLLVIRLGLNGLEPSTSRLSGVRSNQLSYKPIVNHFTYIIMIFYKSGSHLLSHTVSSIVPSAAYVLTIVFGMGTGVSHKRITTGNSLLSLSNGFLVYQGFYFLSTGLFFHSTTLFILNNAIICKSSHLVLQMTY